MYSRAWETVISEISSCSGVLKLTHTFSTAVRITSMSALSSEAISALERSLSMTAGVPT